MNDLKVETVQPYHAINKKIYIYKYFCIQKMLTLTWKQSGGGNRDNKLDSSEGNGKHPPGTAFIPTPETELGLNGSIC